MELRFMKWCDTSEKILQWNSEEVIIPYISPIDNKRHRYFPDFLIQTEKGWTLIEVKPQVQTKPPKKIIKKQLKNFNKAIIEIAEMKFKNIEEKEEKLDALVFLKNQILRKAKKLEIK